MSSSEPNATPQSLASMRPCTSSSWTRRSSRFRPWRYEPPILQALDHQKTPVLAIRLANDVGPVVLVDHLRGGLAVFLHHAINAITYLAQVQPAFVCLASARAFELCSTAHPEDELTGTPAISLYLSVPHGEDDIDQFRSGTGHGNQANIPDRWCRELVRRCRM